MTPLNNIFTWLNKYIYRILTILNRMYIPQPKKECIFKKTLFLKKLTCKGEKRCYRLYGK